MLCGLQEAVRLNKQASCFRHIFPLYGIPKPIMEAIKPLYMSTEATVVMPDGETEFFKISTGVLLGDTLVPSGPAEGEGQGGGGFSLPPPPLFWQF